MKEKVIIAKREAWEKFGMTMEIYFKINQKLFYRVVSSLRKDKRSGIGYINDKK